MKRIVLLIVFFYYSVDCVPLKEYCSVSNIVIVGMLCHNIWTWYRSNNMLTFYKSEIKKNEEQRLALDQNWQSQENPELFKEKDYLIDQPEYENLKSYYTSSIRDLELLQMKATINNTHAARDILVGLAGYLVKLF